MVRPPALSVARLAIADRCSMWSTALKARATGQTSAAPISTAFPSNINRTKTDAFGLLTGQIGYAFKTVLL